MKKLAGFVAIAMSVGVVDGQGISKKLQDAVAVLASDDQMKSGMMCLYVVNQTTGAVVYDKNGSVGVPVASSQKVLTSIAAIETLGMGYRYQTTVSYNGTLQAGTLRGNLYISGNGDPTLGSWRYTNTKDEVVLSRWIGAINDAGIRRVDGSIVVEDSGWSSQTIPGGWIWDDIGNYYGAGVTAVNWHENQYDLKLQSGSSQGDKVTIVSVSPPLYGVTLINELTAGKPGSGDNAYIYLPPYGETGYIRGTIPPGQRSFTVSGSFPDAKKQIRNILTDELKKQGIEINNSRSIYNNAGPRTVLAVHQSPPLDSINYWFLRKSINLYGEALAKTLGYIKQQKGATGAGVDVIKDFWKQHGTESSAINIFDGSGLSPQNRVAAKTLVAAMQYARLQPWFNSFYDALPEFYGIKMKSGTIGGVKSFTGYVNGYTFAIVVNNFSGSASEAIRKMYRVLDVLK